MKKNFNKLILITCLPLLFAQSALAQNKEINKNTNNKSIISNNTTKINNNKAKQVLEKMKKDYPSMEFKNSVYVPEINLYEISANLNGAIVYYFVNENLDFLINIGSGEVLSLSTKENITSKRFFDRNKETFNSLPFNTSFNIVYGNGERKVAVFSDPDCPVCQKMEQLWKQFPPENVTVYYFMNPLKTIHPQADKRAKQIYCSKNPAESWVKYLSAFDRRDLNKLLPSNNGNCENAKIVDEHDKIAETLGFNATPTLMLDNGIIYSGLLDKNQLKQMLEQQK